METKKKWGGELSPLSPCWLRACFDYLVNKVISITKLIARISLVCVNHDYTVLFPLYDYRITMLFFLQCFNKLFIMIYFELVCLLFLKIVFSTFCCSLISSGLSSLLLHFLPKRCSLNFQFWFYHLDFWTYYVYFGKTNLGLNSKILSIRD